MSLKNLYMYGIHWFFIGTDEVSSYWVGERAVKVYRLITRNSYEREMFDRCVYYVDTHLKHNVIQSVVIIGLV